MRSVRLWQWGALLAIVGAVVVIVGAVQTTAGKLPDYCDEGALVAKFNYEGGRYVFEEPAGNADVVTITDGTATGGSWSSTVPIDSIIVKGGTGAFRIDYLPPATSGSFFNDDLPPVGSGNIPDISNLQFCGSGTPTTTTTAPPEPTTTTAPSEPTTTTAPPVTTTTTAPPVTTTTAPSATTTTTKPAVTTTTTTAPPGTTTTTAPPASTTTSGPSTTTTTQVLGVSVTRVEPVGDSTAGGDNLPRTGAPSVPLIVLGAVLVAVGLGLVILSRFRDRNLQT